MADRILEKVEGKDNSWAVELAEDFESQIRYCYPKMENSYKKVIKQLYLVLKNKYVNIVILKTLQTMTHFKFSYSFLFWLNF